MAQTIHSYYFAEKTGTLFGLKPGKADVVFDQGPFISFDKKTRILSTAEKTYHLPIDKAETSKNPNLCGRTKEMLNNLAQKTI